MNLLSYWTSLCLTYCSFHELYRLVTWTPINFNLLNFSLIFLIWNIFFNHAHCLKPVRVIQCISILHYANLERLKRLLNLSHWPISICKCEHWNSQSNSLWNCDKKKFYFFTIFRHKWKPRNVSLYLSFSFFTPCYFYENK